jgi:hypothetical protein
VSPSTWRSLLHPKLQMEESTPFLKAHRIKLWSFLAPLPHSPSLYDPLCFLNTVILNHDSILELREVIKTPMYGSHPKLVKSATLVVE